MISIVYKASFVMFFFFFSINYKSLMYACKFVDLVEIMQFNKHLTTTHYSSLNNII